MTIGNGAPIAGKATRAATGACLSPGRVRIAVTLSFAVFDALKAEALRQDVSIAHLARTYIEIGLADDRRLIDGVDARP